MKKAYVSPEVEAVKFISMTAIAAGLGESQGDDFNDETITDF